MTTGMSKITFRADDELITKLEEFDASKSEVMRDALREYLEKHSESSFTPDKTPETTTDSIDELIADRVDAIVSDRVDALLAERHSSFTPASPQDVNVNITLDGGSGGVSDEAESDVNVESDASHDASNDASHAVDVSKTSVDDEGTDANQEGNTCTQCGEKLSPSHVYCPNCGEKASHRVFCDCGDELRSDWAFCPGCGRRTPAADVLDQS